MRIIILFNLVLIACFFCKSASAVKWPVYISFNGYTGNYILNDNNNLFATDKNRPDTLFLLEPGTNIFKVDAGEPTSEISFDVSAVGKVSILSSKASCSVKDTTIIQAGTGIKLIISRIILNTITLEIDPGNAFYCLSPFRVALNKPYPHYQPNRKGKFVFIKGLSYFIATEFNGYKFGSGPGEHYVPDNFTFFVDAEGKFRPFNTDPVHNIAARYSGQSLTLKTVKVRIDPKEYNRADVGLPWLSDRIRKETTVDMIRGLGVAVRLADDNFFYIIPL